MTMLDPQPTVDDTPQLFTVGAPRLLAERMGAVPRRDREWLVRAAEEVGLRGRGGAAFPVATKLAGVRRGAAVLANGSESEPASWKDRALMRSVPELVVAGVSLVADALRSSRTVIAVSDGASARALAGAAERAGVRLEVRQVRHGFVGGEIGALINGLDGRPPVPDGVRVLPTVKGLGGRSTFGSNVETFAQLAVLAALGPEEYASVGTEAEPGTSLMTLHGPDRMSVMEVQHGTDVRRLLGGVDRPLLLGGYHGTWTARPDVRVERPLLQQQGLRWGAGVVAVLPDETCPVGEVARVAGWLASQSAGQCGPCVFGLPALAGDLADLAAGQRVDLAQLRRRAGLVDGRGACHHPNGVVGFIASALEAFDADVRRHAQGGHCGRPVLASLPVGGDR